MSQMTAAQYRKILDNLELSIIGAAKVLGISKRQSQRYAAGDQIPKPVAKLLRLMVRLKLKPEDVA